MKEGPRAYVFTVIRNTCKGTSVRLKYTRLSLLVTPEEVATENEELIMDHPVESLTPSEEVPYISTNAIARCSTY